MDRSRPGCPELSLHPEDAKAQTAPEDGLLRVPSLGSYRMALPNPLACLLP